MELTHTDERKTTANMNCVKNQTKTRFFYGLTEQ